MDQVDEQWVNENMNPEVEKEDRGEYSDGAYTISFINGQPGLVVRGNHSKEIDQRIRAILPVFKRFKEAVENGKPKQNNQAPQTPPSPQQNQAPTCGIHGTTMVWKEGISKSTNQPYAFWGCPTRNADGSYCKYKPQA